MRAMAGILLAGILMCVESAGADEKKAVFDLRSGDPDRINVRLFNDIKYFADYYQQQGYEFKAVIVISGKAYKFFIDALENSPYRDEAGLREVQATFIPLIQALNEDYNVVFEMCEVGMNDRNIKKETLYPFVSADRIQQVLLIDWQHKGYAYLPFN